MKVQIQRDVNGNVINQSSNPEFGYVRVTQSRAMFTGTFVRKVNLSALIHGKLEDLQEVFTKGMTSIPGKIVIKESLEPTDPRDPSRNIKMAGETGIPCTFQDQPIYRQTVYTPDVNEVDTLIQHDNIDEIRYAMNSGVVIRKPEVATDEQVKEALENFFQASKEVEEPVEESVEEPTDEATDESAEEVTIEEEEILDEDFDFDIEM